VKHTVEIRVTIGEQVGESSLTMEVDDDDPACLLDAQEAADGLAEALFRALTGEVPDDDEDADLFAFASQVADDDDGGLN
jgi:hypothetical protein